jgi:CDP-diacylglycerol--glycerol-3-phosphate 3-phosphatidyltransferase
MDNKRNMIFTLANLITILRILLVFPFVICLLKMNNSENGDIFRMLSLGIFIFMAISDAVDGYLARRKNQATTLGAFLDPVADKLMITCAGLILAVPQTAVEGFKLPIGVMVLIIGKDLLLLLGFAVTYFMTGSIHIRPVWAGKLSTLLQIVTVASILTGPELIKVIPVWRYMTSAIWWSTAGCAILATFIYIYRGIRYIETLDVKMAERGW